MSALERRIKRLEVFKNIDPLRVLIIRWGGSTRYEELGRVTCGDVVIERLQTESEDDFMSRAHVELKKIADQSKQIVTAWADFTWNELLTTKLDRK